MSVQRLIFVGTLGVSVVLAGCGGEKKGDTTDTQTAVTPASTVAGGAAFSTTPLTPDAGKKVIVVEMETDAQGNNKFTPANFEANKGDVIRYTLKVGVHNVHFLPDSNSGAQGLPAQPSELLQLPGQTLDVKVDWAPGKYYFQCDPHALLGMTGHVTVRE